MPGAKKPPARQKNWAQPALAALMRAALRGRTVSPDTEQDAKRKAALRRLPRPNGANCAQADGYSLHA